MGKFDYSFLGQAAQGWSQGYLHALQSKMRQEDRKQELLLQRELMREDAATRRQQTIEDRGAALENEVLKQGGNPALGALRKGVYGGKEGMDRFEAARKGELEARTKLLPEEGPEAVFQLQRSQMAGNPYAERAPAPGESDIGTISHAYGVPSEESVSVSPFEGRGPLKQRRDREGAIFKQNQIEQRDIRKEGRRREQDLTDRDLTSQALEAQAEKLGIDLGVPNNTPAAALSTIFSAHAAKRAEEGRDTRQAHRDKASDDRAARKEARDAALLAGDRKATAGALTPGAKVDMSNVPVNVQIAMAAAKNQATKGKAHVPAQWQVIFNTALQEMQKAKSGGDTPGKAHPYLGGITSMYDTPGETADDRALNIIDGIKDKKMKQVYEMAYKKVFLDLEEDDETPEAPARSSPRAPAESAPTAINPKTGERLIKRNGQWVPINGR